MRASSIVACVALACILTRAAIAQPVTEQSASGVEQIVVTASRTNLLRRAATASQGAITKKELTLRPALSRRSAT